MKVLIVGAGIGGLAAALFLHEAGIECEVYDRSPTIRQLGVGINALPLAVAPLAGLDLAKLVLYPIGRGESPGTVLTNWAICIRTGEPGNPPPRREDWSRLGDRAELAPHVERFRAPHLDLPGLIAATPEFYEYPMCDRDPLPRWSHGRVTLLGDAAHPMYPMGSNGAGQAVLDAVALTRHLTSGAEPEAALRAYQDERLPATREIVLRNRVGGPEMVIDEVERRAPDGFERLDDVIDPAELDAIVQSYAAASVATPSPTARP